VSTTTVAARCLSGITSTLFRIPQHWVVRLVCQASTSSILASLKDDNSNVITELALDAVPFVEKFDVSASFAAHDEAGDAPMREGSTGTYNFGEYIPYLIGPLDLTHTGNKSFEANQHALDITGSSQDLSEAPEPQVVENDSKDLDGDVTLQLYITGRFEITTEILYLERFLRPRTSMHNGRVRPSAARYGQACRCWTCYRRRGGLVIEKDVRKYVEASIECH